MPFIHFKTRKLEYRFEINGKFTIIRGDSGTGKTTFYDLVSESNIHPKNVQNLSGEKVIAVPNNFESFKMELYEGCVLVLDENCTLFKQKNAAKILKDSKNYFLIINRTLKLGYLSIHVDNVFQMKASGKFHTLEKIYKPFEQQKIEKIDTIIVEDKKSGYKFLEEMLRVTNYKKVSILEPAYGKGEEGKTKHSSKSKIIDSLQYRVGSGSKELVLVYDKAAFACHMDFLIETIEILKNKCKVHILDWDCFEGYILKSKVYGIEYSMKDVGYQNDSLELYLIDKLSELVDSYDKGSLHKCFRRDRCNDCKNGSGCKYRLFLYED